MGIFGIKTPGFIKDIEDDVKAEFSRFDDNFIQPYIVDPILEALIDIPDVNIDAAKGVLINRQGNDLKIPVIYGSRRVGGSIDFVGVSGSSNEFLHIVLTLCEGEISSINNVYINDIAANHAQYNDPDSTPYTTGTVAVTSASAVITGSGTTWTSNVSDGDVVTIGGSSDFYYVESVDSNTQITLTTKYIGSTVSGLTYEAKTSLIRIFKYVGTDTQAADSVLVAAFTPWTTAHQLKGVAYIHAEIKYNQDSFSGFPRIVCDIDGKLVADTRTAYITGTLTATNGSAVVTGSGTTWTGNVAVGDFFPIGSDKELYYVLSVDSNTQITLTTNYIGTTGAGKSYKAMTMGFYPNPALCTYDFNISKRYGRGLATTSLNTASYNSSANTCDESITNYTPGGSNINRYECNGVVDTNQHVIDNLNLLKQSCRGYTPYIAGEYHLIIDKDETPTFTFDKTNIIGGWRFQGAKKRTKLNKIKIRFANPLKNWQQDIQIEENSTLLADDNGLLLEKTVNMPFETDIYRAKYHAEIELKKSRQGIGVSFIASWEALQVEIGEVVSVTHDTPGWSAKAFRVISLTLLSSGFISFQFVEHESTVYDRTVPAEAATAPDTNLPDPFIVGTPTGLTLTQQNPIRPDGSIDYQLNVSWTAPSDQYVDDHDVQFKPSLDSIWQYATSNSGTVETIISGLDATIEYDVRIRAVNSRGIKGTWVSSINFIISHIDYLKYFTNFASLSGFDQLTPSPNILAISGAGVLFTVKAGGTSSVDIQKISSNIAVSTFAKDRTIKVKAVVTGTTTARYWISTGNASVFGGSEGMGFRFEDDGNIYSTNAGSSGGDLTSLQAYSLGTLYTLEARFIAGTEIKFYVNGVLKATKTTANNIPSDTSPLKLLQAGGIDAGSVSGDTFMELSEFQLIQYE